MLCNPFRPYHSRRVLDSFLVCSFRICCLKSEMGKVCVQFLPVKYHSLSSQNSSGMRLVHCVSLRLQFQRVESHPTAKTKNMVLYLDEGEPHDGQDPRCGTFTVCGGVETEDLAVRTEGK